MDLLDGLRERWYIFTQRGNTTKVKGSVTMRNRKRPISVTVIAWILIVSSVLSFWFTRRSTAFIIALRSVMHTFICLVSGVAILMGFNWGRLLYVFYTPASILLAWLLYGRFRIEAIIWYMGFFLFLTSPAASAFFMRRGSDSER